MDVRHLTVDDIGLVANIDRSEVIRVGYTVEDGRLARHEVVWDSPPWVSDGSGPHSVARRMAEWSGLVDDGAAFIGAFDRDDVAGLAIVDPDFDGDLAWLAVLHVSRPHRRAGVASRLWDEGVRISRDHGARRMYVSATPSESAVGFYLSKGCILADPPHPVLFEHEPEDIHFTVDL